MKTLLWLCLLLLPCAADAARIGEITETGAWEQATRFFTLRDTSVKLAVTGSILLGISCGLLGAFLVVRKLSLVGDVLSHAVLPGVMAGFLWNISKDPVAVFIGASIAGLLGTFVVTWLTHTTKLKEDTALALVLAVFFAVGVAMMGIILRLPDANKSGVDKIFLGQAAALSGSDIEFMAGVTAATLLLLTLFYKELLVVSFDAVFARTIGIPARWVHAAFMFLLSAAIIVALQAVGAVLISAMLITPAATAYLLTNRMHKMILLSAIFGVIAGLVGAFISFLGNNLPTGPCMVLAAGVIFSFAMFFSPLHGIVPRWIQQRSRSRRAERENTLKAIYQILETSDPPRESVSIPQLAAHRHLSADEASREVDRIARDDLAVFEHNRQTVRLSTEGRRRAAQIVRNHRLWELYLTERANFQTDHVHDSAEQIEHVLDEETVKLLERRLGFPERDPHGKTIPRP